MPRHTTLLNRNTNLLLLHLTVFVWGFTGIMGALISISAAQLVWYRVLIALLSLMAWFKFRKISYTINQKTFIKLFFTGGLVGLHWILFFYSIKVSTVSVTLICLSSLTLFTAILEPLINKTQISKVEIITGMSIISGICLIFKFESGYALGIFTGLISAACASLFSVINSKLVKKHEPTLISFYELFGA